MKKILSVWTEDSEVYYVTREFLFFATFEILNQSANYVGVDSVWRTYPYPESAPYDLIGEYLAKH